MGWYRLEWDALGAQEGKVRHGGVPAGVGRSRGTGGKGPWFQYFGVLCLCCSAGVCVDFRWALCLALKTENLLILRHKMFL